MVCVAENLNSTSKECLAKNLNSHTKYCLLKMLIRKCNSDALGLIWKKTEIELGWIS